MFKLNGLKIRSAMKAQGITADELATRAEITPSIIEDIKSGRDSQIKNFAPLVALGAALKVSPFELVVNQTVF